MDSDGPTTGKPNASRFMQDAEVQSWLEKAMERWRLWAVVLVVAIVGIYYLTGRSSTDSAVTPTAVHPIVPVAAVPAKLGDLKQYISAIGTVTAYNTVTVKSRVDGQLNKANFTEGQMVKAGDVLAEIEEQAAKLGADAVVGVDIDYESVGDNMLMVSASGTAVKLG